MEYTDLVDIWRVNNPGRKQFTYQRSRPMSKSIIDFFVLISECLLSQQTKPTAKIVDRYLADHALISLEVQLGKTAWGKSYWKLNNDLLRNEEYVDHYEAFYS